MKKKLVQKGKGVVIYQAKNGAIELRGDTSHETIWATQAQIAEVFGVERSVVTKHIRNIFKEGELAESSVCANFAHTAADGKTYTVSHYNLDVIISVGYRVNSKTATQFRQWATKTLREHITKGFTINRKRIGYNYDAFMKAVGDIQALLPEHVTLDPKNVLDLIKEFAATWVSIDAYDKESPTILKASKKSVQLTSSDLLAAIGDLKRELMKKDEATDMFAMERKEGSIEGIIGSVMQTFGGKPVYASLEEKAAHLLYFMVKNHPFTALPST